MRISELLGLVWSEVDFESEVIRVSAQLSRSRRGQPARRVAPKTRAAVREIPLVLQQARVLRAHRDTIAPGGPDGWVFPSRAGTPLGHRNAQRRALATAARRAGLEDGDWPPLRFHDLRHTFASHLIVELRLDVAQVSRIMGHASVAITLDVYTHLFDRARHGKELLASMGASHFASLLEPPADGPGAGQLIELPHALTVPCVPARERAALRWGT